VLVAVWLAAIWVLLVDPRVIMIARVYLPKWPTWCVALQSIGKVKDDVRKPNRLLALFDRYTTYPMLLR